MYVLISFQSCGSNADWHEAFASLEGLGRFAYSLVIGLASVAWNAELVACYMHASYDDVICPAEFVSLE